jgi:hypothetical protein
LGFKEWPQVVTTHHSPPPSTILYPSCCLQSHTSTSSDSIVHQHFLSEEPSSIRYVPQAQASRSTKNQAPAAYQISSIRLVDHILDAYLQKKGINVSRRAKDIHPRRRPLLHFRVNSPLPQRHCQPPLFKHRTSYIGVDKSR